jgi:hypothetical protein
MFRWQDPAPPAVAAIRERRMVRLFVAQHGHPAAYAPAWQTNPEQWLREHVPEVLSAAQPAAEFVPSMTINGVEYVERPEPMGDDWCIGCAFDNDPTNCLDAGGRKGVGFRVFGGGCADRGVIYIRKA